MPTARTLLLMTSLGLALASLGGCSRRYAFEDDLGPVEFELNLFGPLEDELRSPYATGTAVDVSVLGPEEDERDALQVESSDPAVLRVDSFDGYRARIRALGEGTASLRLRDGGAVVHSRRVEVVTPDRVELFARGPLLAGRSLEESRVDRPLILAEYAATFRVRYLRGDRVVHGKDLLRVEALDYATTAVDERRASDRAEWLQVLPHFPGVQRLALFAADAPLGVFELEAVEPSVIASVDVIADELGARHGDPKTALARAWSHDGRVVWGAPFAWTLGGTSLDSGGDLLDYTYDSSATAEVTVSSMGASTAVSIHAISATVVTSTVIPAGCAAAPGARSAGAWASLLAVGLVLWRRRRRGAR